MHSVIHLFDTYVLSTYFGSIAILGARDSAVNDKILAIKELLFQWGLTIFFFLFVYIM